MRAVELPSTDAMVVAFVKTKTNAHVGTKVLNPRPTRYVQARRTGGAASNRILDHPMVTLTCAAESSTAAEELALTLREAFFHDYSEMPLVRGVEEVSGPYFDPDPDTGGDRYSFTLALTVRAKRI